MNLGLEDKVAWVTGASSGIGKACALSLAAEKALVAISARRADLLEQTAAEITNRTGSRCIAVPLDVTDANAISAAAGTVAAELGPIDILVSNAGGPPSGPFDAIDDDRLYDGFTLTTASAWRLAGAVAPSMKQRGRGCMVFMTSWSTKEVIPNLLLSNSLRAAVVGLAKTLSKELGPHGIRVLTVAPGRIATARIEDLDRSTAQRSGKTVEQVAAESRSTIPLGRYGEPSEIGDVVAFLASERASYLSGINVLVDGGMLNGILS